MNPLEDLLREGAFALENFAGFAELFLVGVCEHAN
jgi:hypothetical protein